MYFCKASHFASGKITHNPLYFGFPNPIVNSRWMRYNVFTKYRISESGDEMQYVEFGKENKEVILLLHGGGLSWWNYKEAGQLLQKDYHVVLPILNGHSGSDAAFTTIEDNASKIISFIDTHFGGSVSLIGGLSLGGQILLEILAQRSDICRYALIESALVIPSKLTCAMVKPAFGSCYGLIRKKWFSVLQFQSLKIKQELFEDYYRDTCRISKEDMIAFLQANAMYPLKDDLRKCKAKALVVVGEKENRSMVHSAKRLHEALEGSELKVLPKLYHGEFSINRSEDYVRALLQLMEG